MRLAEPLIGVRISPAGLRGLHRYLFQDVYPWAGRTRRSMTLSKGDAFLHGRFVDGALARQFELLKAEKHLKGLTLDKFAQRAAFHICEINFIHPFREGNGRTLRLFLRELARQAGHELDIGRVAGLAWMQASIVSTRTQDYGPMTAVIRSAIIGHIPKRAVAPEAGHARLILADALAEVSDRLP